MVPFLMVLGSILSLSIGTSLAKTFLFPLVGATGTTALRTGFSAIILLMLWRPWRAQITLGDLRYIALYGVTLGVMNLCFYLSIQTIPFGLAVAIEFIGPLSVTLIYSRRPIDFIWIAFAVTGILLGAVYHFRQETEPSSLWPYGGDRLDFCLNGDVSGGDH